MREESSEKKRGRWLDGATPTNIYNLEEFEAFDGNLWKNARPLTMGAIHAKIYHSVAQKSTIMNKPMTLGCIQFRDMLSGWFLGLFGKMVNWRTKEQYLGAVEFSICIHLS